jgi:hypothetical protein
MLFMPTYKNKDGCHFWNFELGRFGLEKKTALRSTLIQVYLSRSIETKNIHSPFCQKQKMLSLSTKWAPAHQTWLNCLCICQIKHKHFVACKVHTSLLVAVQTKKWSKWHFQTLFSFKYIFIDFSGLVRLSAIWCLNL